MFGEDYFEMSIISKSDIGLEAEAEATLSNSEGHNPLKKDLLNGALKKSIPTPVPGLEVYVGFTVPVELKLSASVSFTYNLMMKKGFVYNSNVGRNDVKDAQKSFEVKAEGEAEFSIGPEFEFGLQVTGEVVKLGIEASAGIKATLTVSHGDDDILDNLPSSIHVRYAFLARPIGLPKFTSRHRMIFAGFSPVTCLILNYINLRHQSYLTKKLPEYSISAFSLVRTVFS